MRLRKRARQTLLQKLRQPQSRAQSQRRHLRPKPRRPDRANALRPKLRLNRLRKLSKKLLRLSLIPHLQPRRSLTSLSGAVGGLWAARKGRIHQVTTKAGLRACFFHSALRITYSCAPSWSDCETSSWPLSRQKCGTSMIAAGSSANIDKCSPLSSACKRLRAFNTGNGHNSPRASKVNRSSMRR